MAEFDHEGHCLYLEKKPQHPKPNYPVVGLYFYSNRVEEVAHSIKSSARYGLKITTATQEFMKDCKLKGQFLPRGFAWPNTGVHDYLSETSI